MSEFRLPGMDEIPNVGLYLDQTVQYINGFLEPLGADALTGSMISNYVKKGYIPNAVRKRYGSGQIGQLLMIAVWKNVLSMEDYAYISRMGGDRLYPMFREDMTAVLQHTFAETRELPPADRQDPLMSLVRGADTAAANVLLLHRRITEMKQA